MNNTQLINAIKSNMELLEQQWDATEDGEVIRLLNEIDQIASMDVDQQEYYWSVTPRLNELKANA